MPHQSPPIYDIFECRFLLKLQCGKKNKDTNFNEKYLRFRRFRQSRRHKKRPVNTGQKTHKNACINLTHPLPTRLADGLGKMVPYIFVDTEICDTNDSPLNLVPPYLNPID